MRPLSVAAGRSCMKLGQRDEINGRRKKPAATYTGRKAENTNSGVLEAGARRTQEQTEAHPQHGQGRRRWLLSVLARSHKRSGAYACQQSHG